MGSAMFTTLFAFYCGSLCLPRDALFNINYTKNTKERTMMMMNMKQSRIQRMHHIINENVKIPIIAHRDQMIEAILMSPERVKNEERAKKETIEIIIMSMTMTIEGSQALNMLDQCDKVRNMEMLFLILAMINMMDRALIRTADRHQISQ